MGNSAHRPSKDPKVSQKSSQNWVGIDEVPALRILCEALDQYLSSHNLMAKDLAVAFSAGRDSVVLTYALKQLVQEQGGPKSIRLYYVDHGLRSAHEIQEDIRVVQDYSQRYGWRHRILRSKLPQGKDEGSLRDYRRGLLISAAQEDQVGAILLAHHEDDQKEQFLLRSFRYPSPWSSALIPRSDGIFHRPLLATPKALIISVAEEKALLYHQDSTNQDLRYARNLVRHDYTELIQSTPFTLALRSWIEESAGVLQETEQLLLHLASKKCLGYELVRKDFANLKRSLMVRLLFLLLNRLGEPGEYTMSSIQEFLFQLEKKQRGCFFYREVAIRWNAEYLFLEPIVVKEPDFGYFIKVKGSFRWQEGSFSYSTALAESAEGFRFTAEGDELRIKRLPLDSTLRSLGGERIAAKEWFSQENIPAPFRPGFHGIYSLTGGHLAGVFSPQFPELFWSNTGGASGNWAFKIEYSGEPPWAPKGQTRTNDE
jgi:tRNA(Ile)-lysidine synthetase-like protein